MLPLQKIASNEVILARTIRVPVACVVVCLRELSKYDMYSLHGCQENPALGTQMEEEKMPTKTHLHSALCLNTGHKTKGRRKV